jgi:hypothetical protein
MSGRDKSSHDKEMSSYMKKHANQFKDSVSNGGWKGCGAEDRKGNLGSKSSNFGHWHLALMAGPHYERAMKK